jgi:hypothetical protein
MARPTPELAYHPRMPTDENRPRAAAWRPTIGDAAEVLGERLGGVFVENDGTWVVKVVGRMDADHGVVQGAARRLGVVEGPFRVENADRSWRELLQLTDEVTAYLQSAGVRFTFGLGPDVHREVVELTMAASDRERQIAAELERAFSGRGLVITMVPGFSGGFLADRG